MRDWIGTRRVTWEEIASCRRSWKEDDKHPTFWEKLDPRTPYFFKNASGKTLLELEANFGEFNARCDLQVFIRTQLEKRGKKFEE